MIDYRDFQQQAELDLYNSEKLFREQNYGLAAFCAQQAMEKYLKAYLLKFGLTSNPKDLGHLQYDAIIDSIIEQILIMKSDKDVIPIMQELLDILIKYFCQLKDILKGIKQSDKKSIVLWKMSLNIKMSKDEEEISKGLDYELNALLSYSQKAISDCIPNVEQSTLNELTRTLSTTEKAAVLWFFSLKDLIQQGPEKQFESLKEVEIMIKPKLYGNSPDSISKYETDLAIRHLKLTGTLQWVNDVMDTYPHEQISRYPKEIDGINSVTLYQQNKDALWILIQNVKTTCTKIKDQLDPL